MDNFDVFGNRSGCSRLLWALILGVGLCVVIASFMSCKTVKPVVVPEIHNTYNGHDRDHTSVRGDSVVIRDSIVYRWKHDTLFVDRWHTEFRDRWRTDTLTLKDSIHVRDSVPYPVEVPGPTVYIKSGYTKFTSWFFWICIILFILWAAWKIYDRVPATKPYTFAIKTALKTFLRLKS